MNADSDLGALADLCGIWHDYHDLHGNLQRTSPDTQRAFLAALGFDVSTDAALHDELTALRHALKERWFPEEIIVESGRSTTLEFGLGATWQLCLDGQDDVVASGAPRDQITLPPLASGVYVLVATASGRSETVTVLSAPKHLPSLAHLTGHSKLWGLNLALYGLRSQRNSGLGDFEDLAQMGEIAAEMGAGFLGTNPLHAMGYSDFQAISPYSPSHRGFLNTAYIALDHIPGLGRGPSVEGLADSATVQYFAHKKAHHQALEKSYEQFLSQAGQAEKIACADFIATGGAELQQFARFEALSEDHGPKWQDWPGDTGRPNPARLAFHMWLQWVAQTQLAAAQGRCKAAGMPLGLYLDLAVGSRRDGAESWCEQAAIARGVSIGAPPDHLGPEGQNWNLTAFAPRKLKAARYRPLRRILAQIFRHAGLVRIDHVLGLNRSYWIPDDGSPGGYISQPFESMLAIIKIEAERFNCAVVGEDLGLVPDGFRDRMRANGFYGYSVLQYEKDDQGRFPAPENIPAQVLSCFATHDTPTVKGYQTGRDIDWWERLSWVDAPSANAMRESRSAELAAYHGGAGFQAQIHAQLAQSKAALVAVQLDDVLGAVDAQNLPGTIDQHPNWRRKYDVALDSLRADARLGETADLLNYADRGNFSKGHSDDS